MALAWYIPRKATEPGLGYKKFLGSSGETALIPDRANVVFVAEHREILSVHTKKHIGSYFFTNFTNVRSCD